MCFFLLFEKPHVVCFVLNLSVFVLCLFVSFFIYLFVCLVCLFVHVCFVRCLASFVCFSGFVHDFLVFWFKPSFCLFLRALEPLCLFLLAC